MKIPTKVFQLITSMLVVAMVLAPFSGIPRPARAASTVVFINEIHYDNTGTDTGEAIEIAGPAGTDLSGWSLVLYNGNGGAVYDTDSLSGVIPDQQNGYGTLFVSYPTNGIQNGAPDGVALVNSGNVAVQFLSYEGTFVAVGGPANGMTSTDIGVSQPGSDPIGDSLQLTGTGSVYEDFSWSSATPNTFGAVNTGQTFVPPVTAADPKLNEFVFNHIGTDTHEFVEIYGDANTDYSAYTILQLEGDDAGAGAVDSVIPVGTTDAGGFWTTVFFTNEFENGTVTLLLVESFNGAVGNDLDTNNDGILDATPWSRVVDDVAVSDGGASDRTYAATILAPFYDGMAFGPGGASRIPDGMDSETASDWLRNDFDGAGLPGFTGSPAFGEALNTPGASNVAVPKPPEVCGDPFTPIYTIQGSGAASPLDGTAVSVEGVVVGDFQDSSQLSGFHLQDPNGDGDPATSDGIFVYAPGNLDVSVGEAVRVAGVVDEFFGMTEITSVGVVLSCGVATPIDPLEVSLPVSDVSDWEAYEGMLVTIPQQLYIAEFFNFDRFGEIVLTSERQYQPTSVTEPGSAAVQVALDNSLGRITLDDGRGGQNPDPAIHPNGIIFDLSNRFRGGDVVSNVTGVLDYAFGLYRIQPTTGADYFAENPRPDAPEEVGGSLEVASFNVLNYFTTLDNAGPICGPLSDQDCRGADDADEFERQRTKIIAAISAINADVVGLIEIENYPGDVPVADLVSGLNEALGAGSYDYIATGAIGTDAIRQAFIYKPATVTPLGAHAILDASVDPRFLDDFNRPALAQTFQDNATGGIFTAVVNHLKSKGSDCNAVGDPDTGDGAGNCNLTRLAAAEALVDWLAGDPTSSGDPDFLIIGDLNSYDKEDPIDAILAGADDTLGTGDDYTDLLFQFVGEGAYSYVFDGQLGYLDHALANPELLPEVTGTTAWHINADEPDILDYDTSFKQPAQDALYEPNAFRSSDHDPVIVGLGVCDEIAPEIEVTLSPELLWPPNHKYVDVVATVITSDNFDPAVDFELVSVTSSEPDSRQGNGDKPDDIVIVDATHFKLRAERYGSGEGRVYTFTYEATDDCGNVSYATATVTVPHNQ